LLRTHATYFEDLEQRKEDLAQGAWSTDMKNAGHTPTTKFESLNVAATQEQSELLDVEEKSTLVMRRVWRFVDGTPTAIESSVFPQWLIGELPRLASPEVIQKGTTAWLDENGYPMTIHQDYISARPHTKPEKQFFESSPGVVSIVRRRVSFETLKDNKRGRPLRVMDTVYRSDMNEIVYDITDHKSKPEK